MQEIIEIRDTRIKEKFVIDDEYLNGYARLCGINATGVYMSLCRHVNKGQTCFPSKKLISEELNISERSVYNAIKELEKWNIIKTESQGRKPDGSFLNNIYILLDKKQWKDKPSANGAVGKKRQSPQANDDNHRRHVVPNKDTHKIKDTHIKDIAASTESADIADLFKEFSEINPSTNYGNTTQRKAALWLIKTYGKEKAVNTARYAIKVQGQEFAPVITTPYQLKEKLAALMIFYNRSNKSKFTTI